MHYDTDVLIVGAGPTGLTLACQLQRFGIPFRIIEKHRDRTHESRAFGIQARTMEIFQGLGLSDEFVRRAQAGAHAELFVAGKMRIRFDIDKLNITGTPFPTIYFLPQSDTEEILLEHLHQKGVSIDRNVELTNFFQNGTSVKVTTKNLITNEAHSYVCKYIVGCDGAHSAVRSILGIEFEGASYEQEFMLADCDVDWEYPHGDGTFRMFVEKQGVFGVIPLPRRLDRIISANVFSSKEDSTPPTIPELEQLGKTVTHREVRLKNMIWSSRFRLHHRAVKSYQMGRAFIAGDAAHIHTPVGGQGMNTGIQDVTNLAWKLALTLKYGAPESLLETYQTERHLIGKILVKTTDRIFGLMASKNPITRWFRFTILPRIMEYINNRPDIKQKMFLFMSELKIHYPANPFAYEVTEGADKMFLKTLGVAYRAPDAPFAGATLFQKFAEMPCHILIFTTGNKLSALQEQELENIEKLNNDLIRILNIEHSPETEVIFDRYGVSDSAIYFVRPDGYIGFRAYGLRIDALREYLGKLLTC